MQRRILALVCIIYACLPACAQKHSELIKLPKDTLVKMAMEKLERTPDYFVDFDRVEVWSTPSAGRVDVIFDRHIRYVTRDRKCLNTVTAELVSGTVGGEAAGITVDEFDEKKYYIYDSTQRKNIQFVKETLTRDERYRDLVALSERDGHLTITDNDHHFDVSIETARSYFCTVKIDKRSGKIDEVRRTELTLAPTTVRRIRIH